jgi:hypothetical protein
MTTNQLTALWKQSFGVVPNDEVLDLMSAYAESSDDNERVLTYLMMVSSSRLFDTELDRAEWIALRAEEHYNGEALPPFRRAA